MTKQSKTRVTAEPTREAGVGSGGGEIGAYEEPKSAAVGLIDGYDPLDPLAPIGVRSRALVSDQDTLRIGPLEKIYLIWMVGASCDGCTVAVSGGTHPRVEHLLAGIVPGLPRVELIHTVVSMESGPEWVHNLFMAERGEL
ncbi:MAG: hypothetical protein M3N31_02170, partial [Actinomycetota bacterium]|nr:hypothetical protein [Actinomycetota bacterium]